MLVEDTATPSVKAMISLSRTFFFSSRSRHTSWTGDWSSDVCSSDLGPHVRGPGDERPARHAIRLVRKPRADPRPFLHEHAVPVAHQRLDPRRHQRHTVLGGFDLSGNTNDHGNSGLTSFRDAFFVTSLRDASLVFAEPNHRLSFR